MSAEAAAPPTTPRPYRAPWPAVLGLIGLDYFSTIAYQPSIAVEGAGLLAPLATAGLVLLTCLGVLPVYAYVVGHSPPGQGSIALLEKRLSHWRGKLLLLIVLGFAATNFVFTRTLSTADASVHILNNPSAEWQAKLDSWAAGGEKARDLSNHFLWQKCCGFWNRQLVTTLLLLAVNFRVLPLVWYGFTRRTVYAAVAVVGFFILLTVVILASGLGYILQRPELLAAWWAKVRAGDWGIAAPSWAGTDGWSLVKITLWLLPKMALGLSGFEMSLVLMPLVRGAPTTTGSAPRARSPTRANCWSRRLW